MVAYVREITEMSFQETSGISMNVYFSGCTLKCPGCHNTQMWEQTEQDKTNTESVFEKIIQTISIEENVCLLGGEPLDQYPAVVDLILKLHDIAVPVWLYTGYTEDEVKLIEDGELYAFLTEMCDTIKYGRYEQYVSKTSELASGNQYFVHKTS